MEQEKKKNEENAEMNSYLIESLAPLVFRSGKPFGSQSSAQDVIFPLPSASAGLTRALAIGQGKGGLNGSTQRMSLQKAKSDSDYQKVLNTQARGAFLVRYQDANDSSGVEVLVPKPANAIYFENKKSGEVELIRLEPKAFAGTDSDLCGSDLPKGLLPVQMVKNTDDDKDIKGKPYKKGAVYWTLSDLQAWQNGENLTFKDVNDNGMAQLPIDIRTHVAIDDTTLANEDGKLFQTASFDMDYPLANDNTEQTWSDKRYGFLVQSELALDNGLATFGGERRLSNFKKVTAQITPNLANLDKRLKAINDAQGFSLTFLTPCIFAQGYLPSWIDKDSMQGTLTIDKTDIEIQLKAVAIDRWQGVSGWDSIVWRPKATRKAVSAGSVYWFELSQDLTKDQLIQLDTMQWADNSQDKADGYGTALISAWHNANSLQN